MDLMICIELWDGLSPILLTVMFISFPEPWDNKMSFIAEAPLMETRRDATTIIAKRGSMSLMSILKSQLEYRTERVETFSHLSQVYV